CSLGTTNCSASDGCWLRPLWWYRKLKLSFAPLLARMWDGTRAKVAISSISGMPKREPRSRKSSAVYGTVDGPTASSCSSGGQTSPTFLPRRAKIVASRLAAGCDPSTTISNCCASARPLQELLVGPDAAAAPEAAD